MDPIETDRAVPSPSFGVSPHNLGPLLILGSPSTPPQALVLHSEQPIGVPQAGPGMGRGNGFGVGTPKFGVWIWRGGMDMGGGLHFGGLILGFF